MGLTRQRSRVDGHWWYRTVLIASMTTAGLALILQFIGFVTPGWIILSAPSGLTVSAGVWYLQACSSSLGRCRTLSMTIVENPFNVAGDKNTEFIDWTELQIEVTVAFVSCIASVVMVINALVHMNASPRSYLTWGGVTALLSITLLMVPICRLLGVIVDWQSYITYNTPYSLVASGLGCILALMSAVLDLCAMCMIFLDNRRERGASEERTDLTMNSA